MADFVAKVENRTTLKISRKLIFRPPLLRRFSAPLRRSVIDFGSTDMVPHIAARKTHQWLLEFSFDTPKKTFATKSAQSGHDKGRECRSVKTALRASTNRPPLAYPPSCRQRPGSSPRVWPAMLQEHQPSDRRHWLGHGRECEYGIERNRRFLSN